MPIEFTQESQPTGSFALNFFGARYFDPFFGLWMTPDPAGQYANPYTYGGDPVNFIDPTGLWGLDAGFFTIGWDSNRGWNFGMSAGIFSYTWYQNGSKTFEASIGGSYQFYFLNLGGSLGYSYNTYSGHSLSAGGHACVGAKEDEAGVCAGLEAGADMYWDAYGNFLGMTAYAGPFAELQASDNTSLLKVNGGYERGLFGMEGRGWYGGVSAMDGSLYASWAENGGWSYGFQATTYLSVSDFNGPRSMNDMQNDVGVEIRIPLLASYGHFNIGGYYDVSHYGQADALRKGLIELGIESLTDYIEKNAFFTVDEKGEVVNPNKTQYEEIRKRIESTGKYSVKEIHPDFSSDYNKAQVLLKDGREPSYPHLEFKYQEKKGGNVFSSYNYGNNWLSHLLIDFVGYHYSPNPKGHK